MIIDLQNKNANLRLGLGKLLKICKDNNMHNESEVWAQQIGFADQILNGTVITKPNKCTEQWHVLSANMGDGKCSKCGKKLTGSDLNYK